MSEAVNIRIDSGYAELQFQKDGVTENKIIDIDDLHSVFKENIDYDSGDLGIWGDGAIAVKRLISRGDKHYVLVNAINPVVTTTFRGTTIKNMKFPSLLMAIHLTNSGTRFKVCREKTFILAHENLIVKNSDPMYIYPFTNVWENSMGKICWGQIQIPDLENFSQGIGILQMFIQGDMNTDLFKNRHISSDIEPWASILNEGNTEKKLSKLFKELGKSNKFPYEAFTFKKKNTYGNIIKYCKDNL